MVLPIDLQIDGGHVPEQERKALFSVLDVTNLGTDTYTNISGIKMEQGKTYYVWIMGTYTCKLHHIHLLQVTYLINRGGGTVGKSVGPASRRLDVRIPDTIDLSCKNR